MSGDEDRPARALSGVAHTLAADGRSPGLLTLAVQHACEEEGMPIPGDVFSEGRESAARPSSTDAVGRRILERLDAMALKMEQIERRLSGIRDDIRKTRKAVRRLRSSIPKPKDIKKLKKLLDQLDVIEVGAEDCCSGPSAAAGSGEACSVSSSRSVSNPHVGPNPQVGD